MAAAARALERWLHQGPLDRSLRLAPTLAAGVILLVLVVALGGLAAAARSHHQLDRLGGDLRALQHIEVELIAGHAQVLRTTALDAGARATPNPDVTAVDHALARLVRSTTDEGLSAIAADYREAAAGLAVFGPNDPAIRRAVAAADERFAALADALGQRTALIAHDLEVVRQSRDRLLTSIIAAMLVVGGAGTIGCFFAAQHIARVVVRPLSGLTARTVELARGQLALPILARERNDAVGALARAVESVRLTTITLHRRAFFDPLTGIANRSAFLQQLDRALDDQRRHRRRFAVLVLDLDRFKEVNDGLGHAMGDRLLAAMAARLQRTVRPSDTLARLGGDEFAVVQSDVDASRPPESLAERIIAAAGEPFDLDEHRIHVGASVGIAICPDDGLNEDELLRHADLALYDAKNHGRQAWRFFTRAMNDAVVERRALEMELRSALEMGDLHFVFQPKLDLRTQHMVGVETLARWCHPARGTVPPERFIAVAESSGLIEPLGARALTAALAAAADWMPHAGPGFTVAVNLSLTQLRRNRFVDDVEAALVQAGVEPERLSFEVTESLFAADDPNVLTTLEELGRLGVRLALDDFGTGYASLRHLNRLPFEELKIDRSFVHAVTTSKDAAAVVCAIVGLGRSLDLAVTAEGIETEPQRHFLVEAGASFGQGFLLAPPMDAAAISRRLQRTTADLGHDSIAVTGR